MSKHEAVSRIVEAKNQGVRIHLTEKGWSEFVRLIGEAR